MKKLILIAAAAALTTASVNAQSLVAAWDFNYPTSFGGLDVDGDFSADTSAAATYGTGTFSWANQTSEGLVNTANLFSNNLVRPVQLDTMAEGFGWFVSANTSPNAVLTVSVDLSLFEDAELTFAYAGQNGAFELNVGGQTFSPAADALATIDLGAFEGGVANIDFTFANFSGAENSFLDNIQVVGTAVPEPSTYAAIFGVIALGFAACRRRK
jgi:hypothetical protein